jgi:hypothetical protein
MFFSPIWPRVADRVRPTRLFFDDDNFAYAVASGGTPVDVIARMRRQQNYQRAIEFIDRHLR